MRWFWLALGVVLWVRRGWATLAQAVAHGVEPSEWVWLALGAALIVWYAGTLVAHTEEQKP